MIFLFLKHTIIILQQEDLSIMQNYSPQTDINQNISNILVDANGLNVFYKNTQTLNDNNTTSPPINMCIKNGSTFDICPAAIFYTGSGIYYDPRN